MVRSMCFVLVTNSEGTQTVLLLFQLVQPPREPFSEEPIHHGPTAQTEVLHVQAFPSGRPESPEGAWAIRTFTKARINSNHRARRTGKERRHFPVITSTLKIALLQMLHGFILCNGVNHLAIQLGGKLHL